MAYVKTLELRGRRVELVHDVTTVGGASYKAGAVFVVVGLRKVQLNKHKLVLQGLGDVQVVTWRRKVRVLDELADAPGELVPDCVRVQRGQRFGVCSSCGKRGVYRTAGPMFSCRYCGAKSSKG